MSIDHPGIIDHLSTNSDGSCCVAHIADHLEWNSHAHVLALQEKLNNYLSFIESGEIYASRPEAREQEIEISISCKYTPVEEDDLRFLRFARNAIQKAGFRFSVIIDNADFIIPDEI
ncbi:DUF6572 domain-containing protein [Rubritalea sp.]|uniref:DUF6572 domain-containing protein n=1 Tax=Rubritalea sp. TaxID=2109375 RepID=UPI003EF793C3